MFFDIRCEQLMHCFAFLAVLLVAEMPKIFSADDRITITQKGRTLTPKELAETRRIVILTPEESRTPPAMMVASSVAIYTEDGGTEYPFRMFLPKEIDLKKKYPLIMWLHGLGESRNDNESQLIHMQTSVDTLAGPNRPDFFLIAPQCYSKEVFWDVPDPRSPHGETPLEMLEKITDTLVRDYPIDPDRISLIGICSGGDFAFNLVKKHPDRFSAIAVCSSSAPPVPSVAYWKLPIWFFNNPDNYAGSETIFKFARDVNWNNGDVLVTGHDGGGHDSWTLAQKEDHVIEWLLRQRRNRHTFPRNVPMRDHTGKEILLLFGLPIALFIISITVFVIRRKGKVYQESRRSTRR